MPVCLENTPAFSWNGNDPLFKRSFCGHFEELADFLAALQFNSLTAAYALHGPTLRSFE